MTKAGEQPTITQADIDAAKLYLQGIGPWKLEEIGICHDDPLVEAFAKHRTTSLAAQDLVDCETCCGNGEVVTDWERYKHPHDGDVGDEAVADCPDCDGNGKIEVPSLAAQDGLVEAVADALLSAFLAGRGSITARERNAHKPEPSMEHFRNIALSAIKGDKP